MVPWDYNVSLVTVVLDLMICFLLGDFHFSSLVNVTVLL